ncbi:restriction endonuclease subunit S [Aeromonas veronii]|uniref:restriction endonuclease subunit S n=1 Tax=Aeromonas veronii TaxID=654 RepID=UPI003F748420
MTWPMIKLEELCSKISVGHVGKTSEFYTDNKGVPFLRTQNVTSSGLDLTGLMYVTHEFHSQLKKSELHSGDVVISRVVSTKINCAIIPEDLKTANCANIIVVSPKRETLDSRYLMYYLKSVSVQRDLLKRQVGSAQSVVNTSVIKDWLVPHPPLMVQQRIAGILDKADAIRQKRQQAISLADDFLRSVFLDMFGDPVTNPKGWDVRLFGDISDSQLGKMLSQKSKGGNSPKRYLRNANIRWRHLDLNDLLEMDFNPNELLKFKLEKGDLLVCEGGEIGRCAIWNEQINDCYYQKALHRVRPNLELVTSIYLQEYLYSMSLKNAFSETVSEVTFSHLTSEKIKLLRVPVPPLELQKKFNEIYDKTLSIKESKYQHSFESQYLFEALAQKAFSGQL